VTAPNEVFCRLTADAAERAAAAELTCVSIPGLRATGVLERFMLGDSLVAVAVSDREVVGTVLSRPPDGLRGVLDAHALRRYHLLQYVAVAPRSRRSGVGRRLVALAGGELPDLGVRWSFGGAENAAAGEFFAACGFAVLAPAPCCRCLRHRVPN